MPFLIRKEHDMGLFLQNPQHINSVSDAPIGCFNEGFKFKSSILKTVKHLSNSLLKDLFKNNLIGIEYRYI